MTWHVVSPLDPNNPTAGNLYVTRSPLSSDRHISGPWATREHASADLLVRVGAYPDHASALAWLGRKATSTLW